MSSDLNIIALAAILSLPVGAGEIADINSQLKKSYSLSDTGYKEFYQTGNHADSFSMVCDMGQAIPNSERKGWYTNKPIAGLKLELRARATLIDMDGKIKPIGFVVVTKNNDILINFKPLGDMIKGVWDGDVFNSWSGTSTDISVYSERFGKSGYAHFDLLDGNGFFYKSDTNQSPDYFLSNCRRIKKKQLPVYDWR